METGSYQPPLLQPEAQLLVRGLKVFEPGEVASIAWLRQHNALQRLNTQAHVNVQNQRGNDEYVTQCFIDHSKIEVLIREVVIIEKWMQKVYTVPSVAEALRTQHMNLAAVIYHEALITNMLELFLYTDEAITSISDDDIMLLIDYVYGKLLFLNQLESEEIEKFADPDPSAGKAPSPAESCNFSAATFAVSIARFLIEHIGHPNHPVSLAAVHHIVTVKDFFEVLAPLILKSPWTTTVMPKSKTEGKSKKSRSKPVTMKFNANEWRVVERKEMLRLTQVEAQLWLALYKYCQEREVLLKFNITEHKRELLSKLKGALSPAIIDQMQPLSHLQRTIDMLIVSNSPSSASPNAPPSSQAQESAKRSAFIIEEITDSPTADLSPAQWEKIAESTKVRLSGGQETPSKAEMKEMVETLTDAVIKAHVCDVCGDPAEHKCSRCKAVWYCGVDCQRKGWKKHKKVCVSVSSSS